MRKSQERGGKGGDNGVRNDTDWKPGNQNAPGNGSGGVNGGLRKYLVLLQDCLAIKFVSISQLEQKRAQKYHQQQQNPCTGDNSPHQCAFSSVPVKCQCNDNNGSNNHVASESGNKAVNHKQSDYEIIGGGSQSRCSSRLWESEKGTFKGNDDTIYSSRKNVCRDGPCPNFQALTPTFPRKEKLSMMSKVDHSMQALFLYKEFREINLHCFWNSAVTEAFTHLEYKGSLLPSTIIVGSPIPKYLTILKTAWSRKMLRSPSGYLIDFLGEIEELIADPIAKSHFVPLSDSLCWAIHELTSSGEEAFVDDICLRLVSAYPGMALPTKELIYQTLEKLTRERKIYQTAQGYFVVTPDTHRYISATEPWLMIQSNNQINSASHFLSPSPPNLDEVIVGKDDKKGENNDVDSRNDYPSRNAPSPDSDTYSLPYGTFKRYNSLRIKKNGGTNTTTGCLSRTLSMRIPKSKSKQIGTNSSSGAVDETKPRASDVVGSFQNQTVSEQLLTRRRKHKSFLSRLLSFHGVRRSTRKAARANKTQMIAVSRNDKKLPISNNGDGGSDEDSTGDKRESKPETNLATTSTQTNTSIENLNQDLALLRLVSNSQHPTSKESTLEREQDADSGRCTDSHSDADAEITAALSRGRFTPTLYPEGRRGKEVNRNVYEKIENELGLKVDVGDCEGGSLRSPSQSHISNSPSPSTFTNSSMTASGRMGQSGVSSRNHHHHHRCPSAASSSGYSYRDFYNLYRRRNYPSYFHQSSSTPTPTSPTSQESTSEFNELDGGKPIKPNIRYPPRSFERKQIFDEVAGRNSFREKRRNLHKSVSISIGDNSPGKFSPRAGRYEGSGERNNQNDIHSTANTSTSTSTLQTPASPTSSSTTFTQTLKNSTNLELEFHLPLGNLITAAMNNAENDFKRPSSTRHTNTNPEDVGVKGEKTPKSPPQAPQHPSTRSTSTFSEVNTMVNDLFTIKSFVKSNPFNDGELSSTIEFKTRGSGSNLENSTINNNNNGNNGTAHDRDHKDHRHHHRQRYMIETVSAKPYTSVVHTKFNRESEII